MIGIIMIGAIIVLALWVLVCNEFDHIAKMKGHESSRRYFWFTFFFSIAGMAMVIALPDRAKSAEPAAAPKISEVNDELPEL